MGLGGVWGVNLTKVSHEPGEIFEVHNLFEMGVHTSHVHTHGDWKGFHGDDSTFLEFPFFIAIGAKEVSTAAKSNPWQTKKCTATVPPESISQLRQLYDNSSRR